MSTPELDALIVENLSDLDATFKHLERIEAAVFEILDKTAEKWAEKANWTGEFDYMNTGLWLCPVEWKTGEEDDATPARFSLDVAAGDTLSGQANEDWSYLTRLCGAGDGQLGFRFEQNIIKPRVFKRLAHEFPNLTEGTAFSRDSEGSFFMPFKLDPKVLAKALLEEDVPSAFDPFRQALENLRHAKPAFDKLVEKIKVSQG